jgi:pimeloyl-ACP methyl ester carboxylesterase
MASASSISNFASVDQERLNSVFARLTAQLARPAVEFSMLLADPVFWGWGVPRGDGHSVLALPGLGGGDGYLRPMRGWLGRIGYRPVGSGLDVNPGWSEELIEELAELVEQEFRRSRSKVTIIGHSLGGMFAYVIAAHQPHMIRQIITLASPLLLVRRRLPRAVPITAFYSPNDSIVRHPAALAPDPHARNIEVDSSHFGMIGHSEVYRRLGPLLRQAPTKASNERTSDTDTQSGHLRYRGLRS